MVELFSNCLKSCIKYPSTTLHTGFIPFITKKITTNSAGLNLLPYSTNLLTPSKNKPLPPTQTPPSASTKMRSSLLLSILSLLALSHTIPLPQTDYNPVDVVSNSVSPLSANNAGNSNSDTGLLDGADITIKRNAQSNPADVIANSLSPLSDNVAGNNNQNTGTLDGDSVTIAPDIDPTVNL